MWAAMTEHAFGSHNCTNIIDLTQDDDDDIIDIILEDWLILFDNAKSPWICWPSIWNFQYASL